MKTHAEGGVESMGTLVEIHGDKRRGAMDISDIGKEALIDWNGPPLARADKVGKEALERHFGKGRWNCVTRSNKKDSNVTKMLKME